MVSIQVRSATLHLTSFSAYFLTHLLFLGKITGVPLYELDLLDLREKSNAVFPYAVFSLSEYNVSHVYDSVPPKVFLDCGIDFDLWYPLPRRIARGARFMLMHRREREHQRRTLDTVRERFDVRGGPLRHADR